MKVGTLKSLGDLTFTSLLGIISDIKSYRFPHRERLRDLDTVRERKEHEGRGFLTITLPNLGKALDRALQGEVRLDAPGFSDRPGRALPDFLYDLFAQVFDRDTGFVLPPLCVNPLALRELRQVCFYAYKEEYAFTREHEVSAVQKLCAVDSTLPCGDYDPGRKAKRVVHFANLLCQDLFRGINPLDIVPSHGPGAVATREKPFEKMAFSRVYKDTNQYYPYQRYYWLGWHHLHNDNGHSSGLTRCDHGTSRMCLANKDSRGPRTISLEPLEKQWIQQGLKALLYDWIESHPFTKGYVNFTNQEINRELALKSSIDGRLITLDLRDASNSNSLWLVQGVLAGTPILPALLATRSTHMKLLDGNTIELKMFAPMGSAVCFPVEAIIFWALCVACLVLSGKLPLGLALKSVWVFGDDIITVAGIETYLSEIFQALGLKINEEKSCTKGNFRESCGCDAFCGSDVTPIKVRKAPPQTRLSADSIVSWAERGNMLLRQGYTTAAHQIFAHLEKLVGKLPTIPWDDPEVDFLHKRGAVQSFLFTKKTRLRWVPCQQTWMAEVWTWTGDCVNASPINAWSALLLRLVKVGTEVRTDKFVVPKNLRLKKTWVHLHGAPVAVMLE